MNLALDCDDVLAKFNLGLAPVYNQRYGTHHPPEDFVPDPAQWSVKLGPVALPRLLELFLDEEYVMNIDTVEGAVAGVQELHSLGIPLYVITNRLSTPRNWTQAWLDKNFGAIFRDVLYGSFTNGSKLTKGELCRQYNINLCVEDLPRNVENLQEHGIHALLLDYHWNREVPESSLVTRVKDWREITEKTWEMMEKDGASGI